MKLTCKDCGADIPQENMNLIHAMARCNKCNTVFNFAERLGNATGSIGGLQKALESGWKPKKSAAGGPDSILVETMGNILQLHWRWFEKRFVLLGVLCLVMAVGLVVWYRASVAMDTPVLFAAFPVGILLQVLLSYYTLAGLLNRTIIQASDTQVKVRHSPFPWFGEHQVPTNRLEQLYCKERLPASTSDFVRHPGYEVYALLQGGRVVRLVKGIRLPEEALFIESELEKHLGILARPVQGEIRR